MKLLSPIALVLLISSPALAQGVVSIVSGNGSIAQITGDGGPATNAGPGFPSGIAADGFGNVVIADTLSKRVRKVTATTGVISTYAGVCFLSIHFAGAIPHTTAMKSDYWNVDDATVLAKTGHPLEHWRKVLREFGAEAKKSNDVVAHLQSLGVPRYWARTLTTNYLKT